MKYKIILLIGFTFFFQRVWSQQSWLEKQANSKEVISSQIIIDKPSYELNEVFVTKEKHNALQENLNNINLQNKNAIDSLKRVLKEQSESFSNEIKKYSTLNQKEKKELEDKYKSQIKANEQQLKEINSAYSSLQNIYLSTYRDRLLDQIDPIEKKFAKESQYAKNLDSSLVIHKQKFNTSDDAYKVFKRDSLFSLIQDRNKEFKKLILKYNTLYTSLDEELENIISEEKVKENSEGASKRINMQFQVIHGKMNALLVEVNSFRTNEIENLLEELNLLKESTSQNEEINTMPELTTTLENSGFVLPSFNLLGNQTLERGDWFGNVKVFNTSSNKKPDGFQNLLLSENSMFGIEVDVQKPLSLSSSSSSEKIAMRIKGNYLSKSVPSYITDTTTRSFGIFHLKTGLEFLVVERVLSLYSELNYQGAMTGIEFLKRENPAYVNDKGTFYFNTGLRFRIVPQGIFLKSSSSNYIVFDLNLIWLNQRVRDISNQTDKILPVLKTAFSF